MISPRATQIVALLLLQSIMIQNSKACHSSCISCDSSKVCQACSPNTFSSFDQNFVHRSCPCKQGYYTQSINPFNCTLGTSVANACVKDILSKTQLLPMSITSYPVSLENGRYLYTEILLDFDAISINDACKELYVVEISYILPSFKSEGFRLLPAELIIQGSLGSRLIVIPLTNMTDYAETNLYSSSQIAQVVHLRMSVGHSTEGKLTRDWDLYVETKKDTSSTESTVSTLVVDLQPITCKPNKDCILIPNKDIYGILCTDATCNTQRTNSTYTKGDTFIAKISFVNPSGTLSIDITKFLYKNSLNFIEDRTTNIQSVWDGSGLIVKVPLDSAESNSLIHFEYDVQSENRRLRERGLSSTSDIALLQDLIRHPAQFNGISVLDKKSDDNVIGGGDDGGDGGDGGDGENDPVIDIDNTLTSTAQANILVAVGCSLFAMIILM